MKSMSGVRAEQLSASVMSQATIVISIVHALKCYTNTSAVAQGVCDDGSGS